MSYYTDYEDPVFDDYLTTKYTYRSILYSQSDNVLLVQYARYRHARACLNSYSNARLWGYNSDQCKYKEEYDKLNDTLCRDNYDELVIPDEVKSQYLDEYERVKSWG